MPEPISGRAKTTVPNVAMGCRYCTISKVSLDVPLKTKRSLSVQNFRKFLQYCSSLHWSIGEGKACSAFELAVAAYFRGFHFDLPKGAIATPHAYAKNWRDGFAVCKLMNLAVALLLLEFSQEQMASRTPKELLLALMLGVQTMFCRACVKHFVEGQRTPLIHGSLLLI